MSGTESSEASDGAWHDEVQQLDSDLRVLRSIYRDIRDGIKRTWRTRNETENPE